MIPITEGKFGVERENKLSFFPKNCHI